MVKSFFNFFKAQQCYFTILALCFIAIINPGETSANQISTKTLIAVGGSSGQLEIWNANKSLVKSSFQAHTSNIWQLKFIPTLNYLISCSDDAYIKVWSTLTWSLNITYSGHKPWGVTSLEQIDDFTIASGSTNGSIHVWDIQTATQIKTIDQNEMAIFSLLLLTNDLLAAGLNTGKIQIWNWTNESLTNTLSSSACIYYLIKVNHSLLASAKSDSTIDIWNFFEGRNLFTLRGHTSLVNALKMIQPNVLASASSDSVINLWDLSSYTLIRILKGHVSQIRKSLDLSLSNMLISGSYDSKIIMWNVTTGQEFDQICASFQVSSLVIVGETKNGDLIIH